MLFWCLFVAGVSSENITLNPSGTTVTCGLDHLSRRRSFIFSKQKLVTYSIDDIAACVLRTESNKSSMYYYYYYYSGSKLFASCTFYPPAWSVSVCLFVSALKGKRLELSLPNLVHIYSISVARHALTQRSKVKVIRLRKPSRSHGC